MIVSRVYGGWAEEGMSCLKKIYKRIFPITKPYEGYGGYISTDRIRAIKENWGMIKNLSLPKDVKDDGR